MTRLYNQTKNALAWSMSGASFATEPWGPVDLDDALASAAISRGLPLAAVPVAPETRAHVRIADERAAADQAPLLALKAQLDEAQASEREAKAELGRVSVDLSAARVELREAEELIDHHTDKIRRLESDKDAADQLLSESERRATDAEARAIRAEALLAEKSDKPKAKAKPAETAG